MNMSHWLKATWDRFIVRHVVAEDPSERQTTWERVHPTHDDEDARDPFYRPHPMGAARLEHWRAVMAGVVVDYWTAAVVVGEHRYCGESYVSAAEAVGEVGGLIERVAEAERGERATAQGTCD